MVITRISLLTNNFSRHKHEENSQSIEWNFPECFQSYFAMFLVSPPSFWVRFGNRHSLPSFTQLSIVFQGNLLHGWSGESSYPASHFSTGRWICTTLQGTEKFCNVKKMWQRRIFRSSWLLQVWYLRAYILHRFFLARFFHDELEIICSKWFTSFVSLRKPH